MFNLFRSRDKLIRIMLGAILVAVAASMTVYLIPGAGQTGVTSADDPVLAEVGGEKITTSEAQRKFQQTSQSFQIPAEMAEVYFPQFFDALVSHKAAAYEAARMGLVVTDEEVLQGLMAANPQFFQNGALTSREQYEQYLAAQGFTLQGAIDSMREDMLVTKLQNAAGEGIVVTPKEIEDEFKSRYEKAKIQYIAFPQSKFMDQVKPTEDELRKIFESNRNNYMIPAKSAYQVLVLDQEKVEQTINPTDAELRAAYSSSMDNFRMPERVHVRHILVGTEGKSDAEKKTLKTKAEDLLKQVKNGADFAEVAKKNSDDKGSGEKGGDLDYVVRGQMVPDFENVAFALKPKEISGIVTTQFGYHIIQVLDKEPARLKPFEEVKAGLLADLRKQMLSDKMQMLSDQIHDALQKAPTTAQDIAKKYGADLVTVPNAAPGDAIPTLGASPEIDQALASMKPNDVSQVLTLPANRLAIVVLNSRTPARQAQFSEVADQVKQNYSVDAAQRVAEGKASEAADRIRKGEDMDKVAKSMKLEAVNSTLFGRSDAVEGLGSAVYVEDAFSSPEGTVQGPKQIQGRYVVYKVTGRMAADMGALAAERDSILLKIKQRKAQTRQALLLDSIYTKLAQEGKAKKYDDAFRRLMASYRPK